MRGGGGGAGAEADERPAVGVAEVATTGRSHRREETELRSGLKIKTGNFFLHFGVGLGCGGGLVVLTSYFLLFF